MRVMQRSLLVSAPVRAREDPGPHPGPAHSRCTLASPSGCSNAVGGTSASSQNSFRPPALTRPHKPGVTQSAAGSACQARVVRRARGEKHVAAKVAVWHLPSCLCGYSTPPAPAWPVLTGSRSVAASLEPPRECCSFVESRCPTSFRFASRRSRAMELAEVPRPDRPHPAILPSARGDSRNAQRGNGEPTSSQARPRLAPSV